MRITLIFALALALAAAEHAAHAAEPKYQYEPKKSTLTGTIKNDRTFFGPPGYGANPKEDQKEKPDLLVLEAPITVLGDPKEPDNVTEAGVRELQLAAGLDPKRLDPYRGHRVEITGVLFHAHTGHHFTKVLLAVAAVRRSDPPKR